MHFRRSAALALAAAAAALVSGCKKVDREPSPNDFVVAAFASPVIPNPNDLSLAAIPTLPASAQRTLLQAFANAGGFPSDQAVSLTIPFIRYAYDPGQNRYVPHAIQIDPATVTSAAGGAATFAVLKVDDSGTPVAITDWEFDPAGSVTAMDGGSWALAIRSKVVGPAGYGNRRWAPGRYVFAIRGGPNGVKTLDGRAVGPDFAVQAALQGLSLDNPQHVPIGTPADKMALLENVRKALFVPLDWSLAGGAWQPTGTWSATSSPYAAVNSVFPAEELASFGTFEIAPSIPTAPVDSGSGVAPLPLDLLRTRASGTRIDPTPFGAGLEGLGTLDGFSTTALVFAPVTVPVNAATVNACNVHLYKITGGTPTLLAEFKREAGASAGDGCAPTGAGPAAAAYVIEPSALTTTYGNPVAPGVACAVNGGACSTVIGLQPAVGIPGTPFTVPALDEATDYAVVITTAVKDMLGRPLQKSTVGKILVDAGFDPVASSSVDGVSYLSGISNETATALERMREQLVPVLAQFRADTGETDADVALAYTFRTQSIKDTARLIVGLPYASASPAWSGVSMDPGSVVTFGPATAATMYGIDPVLLTTFDSVAEIDEVKVVSRSLRALAQNTGAFEPSGATTAEKLTALVAVPNPAKVTGACPSTAAYAPVGAQPYTAAKCAPLVVFAHGLQGSKAEMLALAATFTNAGFVVAAIDAEMHGERSYCTADSQCVGGSTCNFYPNLRTPVDPPIGFCESAPGVRGLYASYRLDCAQPFTGVDGQGNPIPNVACASAYARGTAYVSANRLLSLNFFRLRDALRQDIIDNSALVKALAPIGKSPDAFATWLESGYGLGVDFTKVYFVGHSYGAIQGTGSVAANPRFGAMVDVAGGATFVDIAANPESYFNGTFLGLLAQSGIAPGTPDYMKFLTIGKWVLDPADPANFAPYVTGGVRPTLTTIPATLSGLFPTTSRAALAQLSLCDGTVPNAQNTFLSRQMGLTHPATPGTTASAQVQWLMKTGAAVCPDDGPGHSIIANYAIPSLTYKAQGDIAAFLQSVAAGAPTNMTTPVLP